MYVKLSNFVNSCEIFIITVTLKLMFDRILQIEFITFIVIHRFYDELTIFLKERHV